MLSNNKHKIPIDIVDFSNSESNIKKLPISILQKAFVECSKIDDPNILQNGETKGYLEFRNNLSEWLNKKKYSKDKVDPNNLFITNGISSSLSLIMSNYMNNKNVILVEEPSCSISIKIFKEYGLNIEIIPMDKDGINLNILEKKVRQYSDIQDSIFLYTIPTFHNPTGITLSKTKREELAKIANLYSNFYVLADEDNQFLNFDDHEVNTLADYHPNFISICSFNKIFSPSIKLGWIYINTNFDFVNDEISIIEELSTSALVKSSRGLDILGSLVANYIINNNLLDEYLSKIKIILKERCKLLSDELKKGPFEFEVPKGGYFLWIKSKLNSELILPLLKDNKVIFDSGKLFSSKNLFNEYFRLSFSFYEKENLKVGVDRLINFYEDYDKIKVSVLGYNGKLGSKIVSLIEKSDKYKFISGISRDILSSFNENSDVVIDVSSPKGTDNFITYLLERKIYKPLIIGTTGHSNYRLIKKYSTFAPTILISNFSEANNVVKDLSNTLNKLSNEWNFNIIDKNCMNIKTLTSQLSRDYNIETVSPSDSLVEYSIKCNKKDEEIIIKHIIKSNDIYAQGCLKIIDKIVNMKKGLESDLKLDNDIIIESYCGNGDHILVIENYKDEKESFVKDTCKKYQNINGVFFINEINIDENNLVKWDYYNKNGSKINFYNCNLRFLIKHINKYYNYDLIEIDYLDITYEGKIESNECFLEAPDPEDGDGISYEDQSYLENQLNPLGIEILDIESHKVDVLHLIVEIKQNVLSIDENIFTIASSIINEYYKENISNTGTNINFINMNTDIEVLHQISIVTWDKESQKIKTNSGTGTIAAFKYYLNDTTIREHLEVIYFTMRNNTELSVKRNEDIYNGETFYLSGKVENYNLEA